MSFLSALSDDQKALLGCVVAESCTSLLLIVSNFIGKVRGTNKNSHVATLPLKKSQSKEVSQKKAA